MEKTIPKASLESLADKVRDAHEIVGAAVRDAVIYAIKAGELLLEAKAALPHGRWAPWLRKCGLRPRTAQGYMRLARNSPTLLQDNAERVAHLTLRGALALLAKPKQSSAPKGKPQCESDISEGIAAQLNRGVDPLRCELDEAPQELMVDRDDVGALDEFSALRQAIEEQLPAGCVLFLLATRTIDPAAHNLIEQLAALSHGLGWIVRAGDDVRIIIGTSPLKLTARPAGEPRTGPARWRGRTFGLAIEGIIVGHHGRGGFVVEADSPPRILAFQSK